MALWSDDIIYYITKYNYLLGSKLEILTIAHSKIFHANFGDIEMLFVVPN
jgi:hypothetical protein